jgi:hypothetical protein
VTACLDHGLTGHCSTGRHNGCAYAAGGACERGIWLPECYLTLPPRGGRKGDVFQRGLTDGVVAQLPEIGPLMVVRPGHVYVCGCDCHQVRTGQLELFEVAS